MQLAPEFALDIHAQLTQQANEGMLNDQQLALVILANLLQDTRQTESWIHFDNCAFPDGIEYIAGQWDLIREIGDPYSTESLGAFGQLLHTVQDFYAHSNWIELHTNQSPIPVWDLVLSSLPPEIVSGTWFIGHPKRCAAGAPTHAQLNKDSADSAEGSKIVPSGPNQGKSLFQLAFNTALAATKVQFAHLRAIPVAAGILKGTGKALVEGASQLELLQAFIESMHAIKH